MTTSYDPATTEKEFKKFIGITKNIFTYLHNTESESIAKNIISEGFNFEGYIDHTTDLISGDDAIELRYFQIKRGRYGIYTMVIQIGKNIIDKYCVLLKNTHNHYSEVLTKTTPQYNTERDPIYTLPEYYIKGYFNQKTKIGVLNPKFDPYKDLDIFEDNVKAIIASDS